MDPNHQRAFNLFFQTEFTQQQIADLLDIDRRTLYRWMKEGGWKRAKYAASHAPNVLMEQYYDQLGTLNMKIAQRTDQPYPTKEESEIIRRLTMTIKHMRTGKSTLIENIQVFQSFTDKMVKKDLKLLQAVIPHLDKHVKDLTDEGSFLKYSYRQNQEAAFDKEYGEWLAAQEEAAAAAASRVDPIEPPAEPQQATSDSPTTNLPADGHGPELPIPNSTLETDSPNSQLPTPNSEKNGTSNGTLENPSTTSDPLPGNTSTEKDNKDLPTKNNFSPDNLNPGSSPDTPDSNPPEPPSK